MITLADVVSSHIVKFRNNLYTTIPAIITKVLEISVDGENIQAVNVSLAIDRNSINGYGDEEALTLPIVWPSAGGYSLKMKIEEGDEVLVHFSMRPTEEWLLSDGVEPVQASPKRMHDINDGFAVPTLTRYSKGMSGGDYNIELGDGEHNTLKIKDGEVIVTTENASAKLTGDGDIFLSSKAAKVSITKGGVIELGEGATEPLVLGNKMLALFNSHTHPYIDTSNPVSTAQITAPPLELMESSTLSAVSKTK